MARLPRYVIPGQPQHIIQRGNNRQAIFANDQDLQFFRDALIEASGRFGLAIHAYVFMTSHIHLLVTPFYEDSISKTLQSVGRRYVPYFNFNYQRTGTLWEGRYLQLSAYWHLVRRALSLDGSRCRILSVEAHALYRYESAARRHDSPSA